MKGLEPEELKGLILSVGTHKGARPLSPVEVGRILRKALDAGATLQECAATVHLDGTSMVSRFLQLSELVPEVQHLVDWGQSGSTISFTSAYQLSRLDSEEQAEAVQRVLENQLSGTEVRDLVQVRRRSKAPLKECVERILKLRPRVEVRHVFIGAVIDDKLRVRLAQMRQSERDELLGRALRDSHPDLPRVSARLGKDRFTIVGDEGTNKILRAGEDFETAINRALAEAI